MTQAHITDAKAMATKLRASAALVLAFGAGRYSIASYGHTRRQCDAAKQVNDRIAELIEQGVIVIPEALNTQPERA